MSLNKNSTGIELIIKEIKGNTKDDYKLDRAGW